MDTLSKKQAQESRNNTQHAQQVAVSKAFTNAFKHTVKGREMWHVAVVMLGKYCSNNGDYSRAQHEFNKLVPEGDSLPLQELSFWMKNVAGIELTFHDGKYTSKKTPKGYVSTLGIAFTYDDAHREKMSNSDYAWWKILPKKDLSKQLEVKDFDELFSHVLRTLAAQILAGKITEQQADEYFKTLPKQIHDLQANDRVKSQAKKYHTAIIEEVK